MRIVFIGDSITESGKFEDREQLGNGYVRLIHDYLRTTFPAGDLEIVNKGISGNRVHDLAARWQTDVIDMKPDVLSISIGINDVWRQLNHSTMEQIYPDEFLKIYDDLLKYVRKNTNAKIILMEPTVIEENPASAGNEKLKAYVEIVNTLAEKYDATIVPTHGGFLNYVTANKGYALTVDGVHMNPAGNMLMAKIWLEAAKQVVSL